jgi:hypothetical protein
VITIPVTYVVGGSEVDSTESFAVPQIPAIASGRTNEATFRQAIDTAPLERRQTISDLYRELVLANFATFDGKGGASADPELSRAFPDAGTLPDFVRKSGRFNAAGMILHNAQIHAHDDNGYAVLPAILSALVEGGWPQPRCILRPSAPGDAIFSEVTDGGVYTEGSVRSVLVNAFERSAKARQACLAHHGYDCACCGFNFERAYGEVGTSLIHVHHLIPLATIGASYTVDPIRDMVPVCPNCHTIIHRADPPYRVNEVRVLLSQAARAATDQTSWQSRQPSETR